MSGWTLSKSEIGFFSTVRGPHCGVALFQLGLQMRLVSGWTGRRNGILGLETQILVFIWSGEGDYNRI